MQIRVLLIFQKSFFNFAVNYQAPSGKIKLEFNAVHSNHLRVTKKDQSIVGKCKAALTLSVQKVSDKQKGLIPMWLDTHLIFVGYLPEPNLVQYYCGLVAIDESDRQQIPIFFISWRSQDRYLSGVGMIFLSSLPYAVLRFLRCQTCYFPPFGNISNAGAWIFFSLRLWSGRCSLHHRSTAIDWLKIIETKSPIRRCSKVTITCEDRKKVRLRQ